ncbi:2-dehydropantoate 2-reductase family protein [Penicillium nucicola]|uniref:2-dehydropantoate 2-reductase family protein n=1 Tax=Penicillium nucicola TaxID=1850975 RepID=UPI0025459229|nr:2-dehydropantoate 2-reductase family protein [Penicillium nucicola]KAJ5757191.1 2-dehydropantoate 2-reductase family protein [Penicillium nucicola]
MHTPAQAERPRVHVLGLGSIGTFAAHSLLECPRPPSVTLLCHRQSLFDAYRQNGNQILLETREGDRIGHTGYEFEVFRNGNWYQGSDAEGSGDSAQNSVIENLIVAVKTTQTVSALRPLQHRLTPNSNILFLQNGSGTIDEVNTQLFPNPIDRPNYIVGVISHGVTLHKSFHVTHTGHAATSLGPIPRSTEDPTQTFENASSYLLANLPLSPRLNATSYTHTEILQIQLEKLAVNAFCNPLCALNDAENGFLFSIPETRLAILTEISNVVCALPELQHVSDLKQRFAVDKLEATVNAIIEKTFHTTCSMVWDLRAGRETEIKFINGYWVKRGLEVGVPTPVNESLVAKVRLKERRN